MTGFPVSAAKAKKESAAGAPRNLPWTEELTISPTKFGSASVSRTQAKWASSPKGLA